MAGDAIVIDTDTKNGVRWSEGINEFMLVRSHAALAVGAVVAIVPSTTGTVTAAPAALSGYQTVGVVCQAASAAGEIIKLQTRGYAEANVEGTTDVAAGEFLEVLATETAFKKDHATTRSVNSVAMAVDAQAANSVVVVSVYLFGERAIIAAS